MSTRFNSLVSLCACCLALGLLGDPAQAQEISVSLTVSNIEQTEDGFLVTGEATCQGPPTKGGVSHDYRLTVLAEIKEGPGSKYPDLAEYFLIRGPAGAETDFKHGSGVGGTMTRDEYYGVNITKVTLGGGAGTGTFKFSGKIPAEHADKPMRIRAELYHQVNATGAPWPAINYQHDEGFSGNVAAMGDPVELPDIPDVMVDPRLDVPYKDTLLNSGEASSVGPDDVDEKPKPYDITETYHMVEPPTWDYGGAGDSLFDGEASSVGVDMSAPKTDTEKIETILADAESQLANLKLKPEQRNELTQMYNSAVVALAEMQGQQIWLDYTSDVIFTASDSLLTYNPVTGMYWTGGKVAVDLANGDWGNAALNITTMFGPVKVPGTKQMLNVGLKTQLGWDYYKVINAAMSHSAGYPTDTNSGGVYSKWGNYGNWGSKSTPGTPEPVMGGYDR